MTLDRRNFLRAAAATVGGAALSACGGSREKSCCKDGEGACCKGKDVKLNISFQEGTPPGANLNEKFDFMDSLGVVGFEPGGRGLAGRVKEFRDALSGRNIKVSAICAGFSGFILSEEEKVRQECIDTMHEIITAAGELGSTGVIIVPAFNSQTPVKPHTQA
ncbi:MAG: twin-arginine translocation signal domain-containing protein, partial [Tannerella sp.]|nr:twin-arginine translocation signal domain-containing protein [Tannerella sp.]